MKDKCNEKVFVEDIGDGYSDTITCGGTYEKIGNTQLAQCDTCKKVKDYQPNHHKVVYHGISFY